MGNAREAKLRGNFANLFQLFRADLAVGGGASFLVATLVTDEEITVRMAALEALKKLSME